MNDLLHLRVHLGEMKLQAIPAADFPILGLTDEADAHRPTIVVVDIGHDSRVDTVEVHGTSDPDLLLVVDLALPGPGFLVFHADRYAAPAETYGPAARLLMVASEGDNPC